jgi:hypothetical protein
MTQLQITFNVTRFTLLADDKVELTGRRIFEQLTTITVTGGLLTRGPILKGSAVAAVRFSFGHFGALLNALDAVPTLVLPVTLKYDDPVPTDPTGEVELNGMALGAPISPTSLALASNPPPMLGGDTGTLEQIAAELRSMNGQLSQGLELLRELRAESAPKSTRGKTVRTLPPRARNDRTLPPRRKTGT